MNGSMQTDIEALAADWLARRDGPAWSHADQAALDAWLDTDTLHRVAFLRLQAVWDESGRLQALGAGWKHPGPPPRGHWLQPLGHGLPVVNAGDRRGQLEPQRRVVPDRPEATVVALQQEMVDGLGGVLRFDGAGHGKRS